MLAQAQLRHGKFRADPLLIGQPILSKLMVGDLEGLTAQNTIPYAFYFAEALTQREECRYLFSARTVGAMLGAALAGIVDDFRDTVRALETRDARDVADALQTMSIQKIAAYDAERFFQRYGCNGPELMALTLGIDDLVIFK